MNVWQVTNRYYANVVSLCTPGSSTCGDGVLDPRCEECDAGAGNSDTTPDALPHRRARCRAAATASPTAARPATTATATACDGCDASCQPRRRARLRRRHRDPGLRRSLRRRQRRRRRRLRARLPLERVPGGGAARRRIVSPSGRSTIRANLPLARQARRIQRDADAASTTIRAATSTAARPAAARSTFACARTTPTSPPARRRRSPAGPYAALGVARREGPRRGGAAGGAREHGADERRRSLPTRLLQSDGGRRRPAPSRVGDWEGHAEDRCRALHGRPRRRQAPPHLPAALALTPDPRAVHGGVSRRVVTVRALSDRGARHGGCSCSSTWNSKPSRRIGTPGHASTARVRSFVPRAKWATCSCG